MVRRTIAMMLVLSMCFSLGAVALASKIGASAIQQKNDNAEWAVVSVIQENGEVVELIVPRASMGDVSVMAITPQYPVGTIKSFSKTFTNDQFEGLATAGAGIGMIAKGRLAGWLAAYLNAGFVGAVFTAAGVLLFISGINATFGNTGIKVSGTLEYTATYIDKDDHYVYGWSIKTIGITPV